MTGRRIAVIGGGISGLAAGLSRGRGRYARMAGFSTSEVPASVQAACLYDASREPCAQCVTFSVGCVLFQVFATEQEDADLSPDNEAWLVLLKIDRSG